MGILHRYRSPEALPDVLSEALRRISELSGGPALLHRCGPNGPAPGASAPSACAGLPDPEAAAAVGATLADFQRQVERADEPLEGPVPPDPESVFGGPVASVRGFPLRFGDRTVGTLLVAAADPGWTQASRREVESILNELALALDHHDRGTPAGPKGDGADADELLQLSEQLLGYEVELKRAGERIQKVERARDELVEKLSQEVRIPVHGIIERIISVLTAEHDSISPASRQALRQALDDGATFLRTLQHMLDLWHMKQSPPPIQAQQINLREVIDEAVFNVQDRLAGGVELVRHVPNRLPRAKTDLAKLNQILFLLLDNAVKFTTEGSIELDVQLEDGQLLCSVRDTGIGIAPEDQKRLFEEFFQVDAPSDGRYRGAGLGLPLARALVEHLGGALSVDSEIGRGSCFSFTLPVECG